MVLATCVLCYIIISSYKDVDIQCVLAATTSARSAGGHQAVSEGSAVLCIHTQLTPLRNTCHPGSFTKPRLLFENVIAM